jgi:uncharacterized protein YbaA (DUF1428 family)
MVRMANYVDGFVIPIKKKNLPAYRRLATRASKIWMEHGALDYVECEGDDLEIAQVTSFMKAARAKPGETVIFSWVVYRSKAHRDATNKKIMADPRVAKMMTGPSPFNMKMMVYGGFKTIVSAGRR